MFSKTLVAGLALAMAFAGSASAAQCKFEGDAAAGKTAANACKGCHLFDAGKPSRPTGPNLSAIYGSKAGTVADFKKYSDAMQAAAGKGLTWDDANLAAYIADPKAFLASVNGSDMKHGMMFQLKDEAKVAKVVAYLKALKDCK